MAQLIIVDFYNFLYRAYYAIRPLHTPEGQLVNAVYGFLKMVQTVRSQYPQARMVVATEGGRGHRHALFTEYKVHRSQMPDELRGQIEILQELLTLMGLPIYQMTGYEADDVIGSLARQYPGPVLIASGDKDLLQLVDERIQVLDSMKNIVYGIAEVEAKLGLTPNLVLDYLSLVGDTSDNIPGADGIGPKGAVKLLKEYGSLDKLLAATLPEKLQAKIDRSRENILLSKQLATLVCDLEVDLNREVSPRDSRLDERLKALNMQSLIGKL